MRPSFQPPATRTSFASQTSVPPFDHPLTVLVTAVGSSVHLCGVTRHAVNMVRSLLTRAEVSDVHLVVAEWQYDSLLHAVSHEDPRFHIHSVSVGKSALSRNLWYYRQLPKIAQALQADVVHLAYPSPVDRAAFRCPTVVTLHDLYPFDIPDNFGFPKVVFNRLVLRQCLSAVDAIACVSETTLQRLDIHAPQFSIGKSSVIYNCVETEPRASSTSSLSNWNGEDFLLCVAQHRRNKNVPLAINIFRRLLAGGAIPSNSLFVIVGIEGPETDRIHRCIDSAGSAGQIVLLSGLTDSELQWCYRHCKLLLAPSVVEGFGLPVVEAMLHHCRVVCSDIHAFREVGGSYCHYVSLQGAPAEAFVRAVCMALRTAKVLPSSTDRFSAASVADAYLRLYAHLRVGKSRLQDHARFSDVWRENKGGHEFIQ